MQRALEAALRVRQSSKSSDNEGEFVFLGRESTRDKLFLFSLLNRYVPFLHQLLGGIKVPQSDMSPYSHHNQVQLAIKRARFKGYDNLRKMSNSSVGHIDQRASRRQPGRQTTN